MKKLQKLLRASLLSNLFLLLSLPLVAEQSGDPANHSLEPSPKTIAFGYYSADAPPVLRIKSGDTVEVHTLITSDPEKLEHAGVPPEQVEQSLRDIFKEVKDRGPGGHVLTGPIFVEGAETRRRPRGAHPRHPPGHSLCVQRVRSGFGLPAGRFSLSENENYSS